MITKTFLEMELLQFNRKENHIVQKEDKLS